MFTFVVSSVIHYHGRVRTHMVLLLRILRSWKHLPRRPTDPATRCVRAAIESDTQHGAVVPPLYLSSNFAFAGFGEKREYDYTRSGNPSRDALAAALADLECGRGAVVTSSGMAALNVLTMLLEPGEHVLRALERGGIRKLYLHEEVALVFFWKKR